MVKRWVQYQDGLVDESVTGRWPGREDFDATNGPYVLASDYDALYADFLESRKQISALQAVLNEAIALLHADIGAYKSEIPHIAQQIEDFLTRYEGKQHDRQP